MQEIMQLDSSENIFESGVDRVLQCVTPDGTIKRSPRSQEWANFPSPISFPDFLEEEIASQPSALRGEAPKSADVERRKPAFLKPLTEMANISLGPNTFAIYLAHIQYYSPVLVSALTSDGSTPRILADVDVDVFGLLVQWLYTQSLLNSKKEPAYQHRLMALWVLANRLEIPALMNDAINMLEERRRMENTVQMKTLGYVYANTVKGDALRRYLMEVCSRSVGTSSSQLELVSEMIPEEMREEMRKGVNFKLEDGDDLEQIFEIDMKGFHVAVPNL
ncbi:hypothetical protein LSUE1_G000532 [Lachnellula suecica]|uniref:BTB domain-containing protein n=1 Tax=Lachnellula suecica TaxID=602035 RepID=A0A8T9CEI7_9HELO|nr:hypothetical protein LSUE1_G000532 [Lachnellula suecica]